MSVKVTETPMGTRGGRFNDFLDVVDGIYKGDDNYVRPLNLELKDRLSKKNPFFEHGEGTLFTAYRNGRCVGRCSASIDNLHIGRYKEDTGFFGFFDTIDDPEVAEALIKEAKRWLTARGMKKVRGPLSLSMNEEIGCLVDGFDTPPMIMMPHHRPYQAGLIEGCGFEKVMDVYSWHYDVGDVNKRALNALASVEAMPEVTTRHVDMKHLERDIRIVMDIFNDAWSDNWGFVPLTESELRQMAKDMKLILNPKMTFITEIDGEPAAVALALPNLNEAIRDLGGKLRPVGLAKMLWRLKVRGPETARLMILGIKKEYRKQRRYAALSLFLYARIHKGAKSCGVKVGELSWTLENNHPVNVGIKVMGGKIYKTYRIFEADL